MLCIISIIECWITVLKRSANIKSWGNLEKLRVVLAIHDKGRQVRYPWEVLWKCSIYVCFIANFWKDIACHSAKSTPLESAKNVFMYIKGFRVKPASYRNFGLNLVWEKCAACLCTFHRSGINGVVDIDCIIMRSSWLPTQILFWYIVVFMSHKSSSNCTILALSHITHIIQFHKS